MKQIISSRFYFPLHTTIAIIGTLTSILFVSSCSKDGVGFEYVDHVDKYMFFTIKIDGKEFTSYGYSNKTTPSSNTGPTLDHYSYQDSAGNPIVLTNVFVSTIAMDFSSGGSLFTSLGDCGLNLKMTKTDQGLAGTYNIRGDQNFIRVGNGADTAQYAIDSSGLSLTVKTEGRHQNTYHKTVEGSFSCKLVQNSNPAKLIPASGTFRMYIN